MKDGRSVSLDEFDGDVVKALTDANETKLSGLSFALVMEHEGQKTVYYRSGQPCYGECRKYYHSHGKKYSDPYPHDEYRPGDLFDPFPDGKPIAVSFGWKGRNLKTDVIKPYLSALFGPKSPWISGFGSPEDIEFTTEGEIATGVIFKNTHIDPTVMINLMQNCKKLTGISPMILQEFGDDLDLLFLSFAGFAIQKQYGTSDIVVLDAFSRGYYNPLTIDIPRFLSQKPRDLTGGFFDEGADYNRKILHEIFELSPTVFADSAHGRANRKDVPNLVSKYRAKVPAMTYDRNALIDTVREETEIQLKEYAA